MKQLINVPNSLQKGDKLRLWLSPTSLNGAVSAKVSDTKIATKRAFQNKHLLLVDHRETGTKVSSTGYQIHESVLKTITRATRGRKHMPLHTKLDHVVSLSTLGEKISNIAIGETIPQLASGIAFRIRIHIECLVLTDIRGCNSLYRLESHRVTVIHGLAPWRAQRISPTSI